VHASRYTSTVKFSLEQLVHEALAGSIPLVDRLRSYLYFAEAGMLEQSTWDRFGAGRSLVGVRGDPGSRPPVLLAAPLPEAGVVPGSTAWRHRAVELLALVSLLADRDFPADGRPVVFAAWRPDPFAASLRALLASLGISPGVAFVGGPFPDRRVHHGVGVLTLEAQRGPAPRFPRFDDVVRLVPAAFDDPVDDSSAPPPAPALPALLAAAGRGQVTLLDVRFDPGSDFTGPAAIEADVGVFAEGRTLDLPGWTVVPRSVDTARADPGFARALADLSRPWEAVVALLRTLARDLDWPMPAPRPVSLDYDGDVVALSMAFALPAASGSGTDRLRDALQALVDARPGRWPQSIGGHLDLWAPPRAVDDPGASLAPSWGPGASLTAACDVVFAVGADPAIIEASPAGAAVALADRIRRLTAGPSGDPAHS